MHIYIRIYVNTLTYIYMNTYRSLIDVPTTYFCLALCAVLQVSMHVFVLIYTPIHIYINQYTCTYIHIIYIYVYIYIYMYVCIYIYF